VLAVHGLKPLARPVPAHDFLCGANARIGVLQDLGLVPADVGPEVAREAETAVKYAGYVARQESEVQRLRRLEERTIPATTDYAHVHGLRSESREKLERVRPRTVGQASRIAGVAPSDISILLVHLEREQRRAAG
jgi:tRNA uridine 5-carboxymethylaminomethyl modification enzyme